MFCFLFRSTFTINCKRASFLPFWAICYLKIKIIMCFVDTLYQTDKVILGGTNHNIASPVIWVFLAV